MIPVFTVSVAALVALLVCGCSPPQHVVTRPPAVTPSSRISLPTGADEGGDTSSCLAAFDYDGRRYGFLPAEKQVPFEVAGQIDDATIPPCSDGGPSQNGTPVAQQIPAYRIVGLDPADAFAIGPSERARMVAVLGERLPPAVEKFIEQNS